MICSISASLRTYPPCPLRVPCLLSIEKRRDLTFLQGKTACHQQLASLYTNYGIAHFKIFLSSQQLYAFIDLKNN